MSAHTPGPWKWRLGTFRAAESAPILAELEDEDGGGILFHNAHWRVNKRDRDLIAAAPDLLAELKVARNVISTACGESAKFATIALGRIDAVIAKAEGR